MDIFFLLSLISPFFNIAFFQVWNLPCCPVLSQTIRLFIPILISLQFVSKRTQFRGTNSLVSP